MKNSFLVLLFGLFFFNSFAQIKFEKGYFLDEKGDRIEVLIKNSDWRNTPSQIQYKTSLDGQSQILNLSQVNELGIYDQVKFVRKDVEIDRSSSVISKMSNSRLPDFKQESLLLKVLVEGEATLYAYVDSNLRRYFFDKENQDIKQLVYKKYSTVDREMNENSQYKQQLLNELSFDGATINSINKIRYDKKSLVNYFVDYNESLNKDFTNFEENKSKDNLNLSIKAGLRSSSFSVDDRRSVFGNQSTELENTIGFSIGLELEYVFGFNGGKWSIFFEPRYQNTQFDDERLVFVGTSISGSESITIDYSSIELNIGLRHYFFLNDRSKLFANAAFVFDAAGTDTFIMYESSDSFEFGSNFNIGLGAGYKFDDRYSVEFLYQSSRNHLEAFTGIDSKHGSMSFILGYTIF
nr:hypothetical protein [uncultured Psychroserpens sp.]